MEIQGKVIAVLPENSGESKKKPGETWKSQQFVIETQEQYSHRIVFEVFGADRIARMFPAVGEEVNVKFDLDAREWNGRWFLSARAYDISKTSQQAVAPAPAPAPAEPAPFPPPTEITNGTADLTGGDGETGSDLPF